MAVKRLNYHPLDNCTEIHFFSVGLSCDIIVLSKAFITGFWSEGMFLIIVFKSRFSVVLCSRKHAI